MEKLLKSQHSKYLDGGGQRASSLPGSAEDVRDELMALVGQSLHSNAGPAPGLSAIRLLAASPYYVSATRLL